MLQGILTQCCFPQLSYLSTNVRELIRIDFLSALPTELAFRILCYLDTTSLCKAAQVSQRWRSLADDDVVWHRMCEQHIDRKCTKCGWGLPLLERKRLRASKRQIQLRATGRGLNEWSPNITPYPEAPQEGSSAPIKSPEMPQAKLGALAITAQPCSESQEPGLRVAAPEESYFTPRRRPWKDVYKDRWQVGSNWRHGRYSIKTFKGHANGVMCLQFDDHILATGSYDATIKIWDIHTGKELRTLSGHTMGVRCLQFDENKLISGSLDKSLKVWNWRTGECHSTYTGHTGGVIGIHFDSAILASGSTDNTVRIWNFESKSTCVLRGHDDWVNSVKVDSASRTVLSASDDCTLRLWDLEQKACIRIFKGHVGQVQQVLPLPPEFDYDEDDTETGSDTDDHSDSSSASPQHGVVTPPASVVELLRSTSATSLSAATAPRYMLSGALDSTIRLWNISTGKCLRTFFGHVEGVWALAADTLRVVSGSEDRTVKVWDTRSGRCERTFTGHAGPVTCIGLSDSRMCTGSEDCEVRMYCFKNGLEDSNGN
jgi:F-box/WD-40 domain protein MET30